MKRNAIEKLIDWKQKELRTPLFLSGIRGCGKTYLAFDFAKAFYEGGLYLNFEQKSPQSRQLLEELEAGALRTFDDFSACICRLFDIPPEYLNNFLVILDEAYEAPALWSFLRSIAARPLTASLLIISSRMPALPDGSSILKLYPLQFDEFLAAVGQEWYSEVIQGHFQTNHRIPGIVHDELLDRFEDYLCTGGIPAAVNEYLCFETTDNLPELHQAYLGHVLYDIYKHYEEGDALKMRQILNVIPMQLKKDNQKFQYRLLRRGATHALYRSAIQALCASGFITLCPREDRCDLFKVFPADVGLLYALDGQESGSCRSGDALRRQSLDCYVMQTLTARGYQPEFWESPSQARIDFLIALDGCKIPVEIKTADNMRSKSVSVYRAGHEIPYSIRVSHSNFEFANQIRSIPYYALFCL